VEPRQRAQVLLELKVLIRGNEHIELRGSESKQFPVLDGRPACIGHGSYGMTGEFLA
jgi:hypothetical protein